MTENRTSTYVPERTKPGQELRRIRQVDCKNHEARYAVEHQFYDGAAWRFMQYINPATGLLELAVFNDVQTAMQFIIDPHMFDVVSEGNIMYWQAPVE